MLAAIPAAKPALSQADAIAKGAEPATLATEMQEGAVIEHDHTIAAAGAGLLKAGLPVGQRRDTRNGGRRRLAVKQCQQLGLGEARATDDCRRHRLRTGTQEQAIAQGLIVAPMARNSARILLADVKARLAAWHQVSLRQIRQIARLFSGNNSFGSRSFFLSDLSLIRILGRGEGILPRPTRTISPSFTMRRSNKSTALRDDKRASIWMSATDIPTSLAPSLWPCHLWLR